MKQAHSSLAVLLGGLALLLTLILVIVSIMNRGLERKLQVQQGTIQQGQMSQQVGTAIVRDAAQLAVGQNNTQLRDLLSKHGITINTSNAK
jgi:hypothetical protein